MIDGGDAAIPRRRWSIPCRLNAAANAIAAQVVERFAAFDSVFASLSSDIWYLRSMYYYYIQ
jgi:hypothetical protein